nr:hypothetical protein [Tanacetum cinerariifolium]
MCERHDTNYIQSKDYQNRDSHDSYSHQSHHDPNDSEKSPIELNNDVKQDLEHFKSYIHSMRTIHDKLFDRDDSKTTRVLPNKKSKIVKQEPQSETDFKNNIKNMNLKMKQNEKNFQTKFKNKERKIDEWEKSQNISLEQIDRTEPPPPPQAHTKQVNIVFSVTEKSDDSL